jgi:hypothetical protein
MSTPFYDLASLVLVPSGTKSQKIYAQKPLTTDGQLAFTRSTTASRIAPNGLLEKVRTNLALYSEDLTNAVYIKTNVTITANSEIAPDGTLTADTITATSTLGLTQGGVTVTSGLVYTMSGWLKRKTGTGQINLRGVSNTNTPITITNDWVRYSVSLYAADTTGRYGVRLDVSGDEVYAWGFQLEVSDFGATDYIATAAAAVSVGPVANVPRLDYLNSTCPRLILEGQRTNLALFSESFNNAYWVKSNATITANTTVSPDGTQNADTAVITAGGYIYAEFFPYAAVTGQSATLSVFAKNASGELVFFGGATTAGTDVYKIENYGNGWYRHSRVRTFTATASTTLQYIISSVGTYIIWGAQVEGSNSAYATSYIPTLGAAVTRGADSASKTGIASLIGQSEGTLFAEFVHNGADILTTQSVISINSGNTTNFVNIGVYDGRLNPAARGSGTNIFDLFVGPDPLPAGTHKIALAYKSNDFAIYLNGSLIYTSTSAATFTLSQLDLGTFLNINTQLGDGIKQALLFPTRLTNAQMAELTTI